MYNWDSVCGRNQLTRLDIWHGLVLDRVHCRLPTTSLMLKLWNNVSCIRRNRKGLICHDMVTCVNRNMSVTLPQLTCLTSNVTLPQLTCLTSNVTLPQLTCLTSNRSEVFLFKKKSWRQRSPPRERDFDAVAERRAVSQKVIPMLKVEEWQTLHSAAYVHLVLLVCWCCFIGRVR